MTIGTARSLAGAEQLALDPGLPSYQPSESAKGTLVAWGDPAFQTLWGRWTAAFHSYHPGTSFDCFLAGTSTAVGALYTKTADIGLFGREIRRLERTSWKRVFPYQPIGFTIATGSFDVFAKTVAVAMLVNRENPLPGISLAQIDAIYSRERRRGAPEPIRTWGQLGLDGGWADAPIHAYGLDPDTGTAQHFRMRVLQEGAWALDVPLPAGAPSEMYAGSGGHAAEALVTALEKDPLALGIGGFRNAGGQVRALALADQDGAAYTEGSRRCVASREYPLSRSVYAFVREAPGVRWEPKVREFVSFILSREGQQAVLAEGDYLPLTAHIVHQERARLAEVAR